MMKDVILGVLITSAVTTQKGRKIAASAGKVGLSMLEKNLKTTYGVDLKEILAEETKEETTNGSN